MQVTMLRSITTNRYLFHLRNWCSIRADSRTFLAEAYSCTEAWNRRHETPLLSKVDIRNLFFELDRNLQSTGKISAVDVDIFVNTVKDTDLVDEVVNLIHQLRLTAEASNILESTHHAVIRYLLNCGDEDLLYEVLNDRLNYGIFPDHYCYNLMMDKFITKNNFALAAKIATLLMLQEDAENVLSNHLAIYACYKYLETPDKWTAPIPATVDPTEEEIKVRVNYLRNPFFDDHFDLQEPEHLVGKTLIFFGKLIDDPLGRTCLLRGYILWMKYKHAAETIKTWMDQGLNEIIYQEVLPLIQKKISEIPEDKITDDIKELKTQLEKLASVELKDGSVLEEMEKRLLKVVTEREVIEITNQCKIYEEWNNIRMDLLEKQVNELDKKMRLENVEKMKRDLKDRERLLTFFDNEEQVELRIEQKLKMEEETFGPYIKVSADIDDGYIPPEITKQSVSLK